MRALRNTVEHHKNILCCKDRSKRPGRRCDSCGGKATHHTVVAVNWFRGDDKLFVTCDEHTLELLKNGAIQCTKN